MKAIAVFLLFVGTIMVLQGYYERRLKTSCPKQGTKIVKLPLSLYEEQLSPSDSLQLQFKSMFDDITTWPTVRNVLMNEK